MIKSYLTQNLRFPYDCTTSYRTVIDFCLIWESECLTWLWKSRTSGGFTRSAAVKKERDIRKQLAAHHFFLIGEAAAGALYLFSGAVFPLEVLPVWLRPVGFAMPVIYWLELMRRSMVRDVAQAFPTLTGLSNLELLGILCGLTVLFGISSGFIFRFCDRRARERSLIDMTTNYKNE